MSERRTVTVYRSLVACCLAAMAGSVACAAFNLLPWALALSGGSLIAFFGCSHLQMRFMIAAVENRTSRLARDVVASLSGELARAAREHELVDDERSGGFIAAVERAGEAQRVADEGRRAHDIEVERMLRATSRALDGLRSAIVLSQRFTEPQIARQATALATAVESIASINTRLEDEGAARDVRDLRRVLASSEAVLVAEIDAAMAGVRLDVTALRATVGGEESDSTASRA